MSVRYYRGLEIQRNGVFLGYEEVSMRTTILLIPLILLLIGLAPAPPNPNQQDLQKLQGRWKLVGVTTGRFPPSNVESQHLRIIVTQNRMKYSKDGKEGDCEWEITLDARKTPKHIDLKLIKGDAKVKRKSLGIYRHEEDELMISWGKSKRPLDFDWSKGGFTIEIYKRLKR